MKAYRPIFKDEEVMLVSKRWIDQNELNEAKIVRLENEKLQAKIEKLSSYPLPPCLQNFATFMAASLKQNGYDNDEWFYYSNQFLYAALHDNYTSLTDAIQKGDKAEIRMEATAVACYAMMLFDNSRNTKRE